MRLVAAALLMGGCAARSSPDAADLSSRGNEMMAYGRVWEAEALYREAIQLDSSFAR